MTNSKKTFPTLHDLRSRDAARVEAVELDYGLPERPMPRTTTFGKPGDLLVNASVGTVLATAYCSTR